MRGFLVTLGILTTLTALAASQARGSRRPVSGREEAVDVAAHAVGRAGPAGQVVLRDDHAARTSQRPGQQGSADRRGGRGAQRGGQDGRRSPRRRRRGGPGARLQRVLVRPRQVDRPDVADHRPAGRPASRADGRGPPAPGRSTRKRSARTRTIRGKIARCRSAASSTTACRRCRRATTTRTRSSRRPGAS